MPTSLTILSESKIVFDELKGEIFHRFGIAPNNMALFDYIIKFTALNKEEFIKKMSEGVL